MTSPPDAEFFLDPVSPFAYLMWTRLRREGLVRDGAALGVRPVPVVLGALLVHWGQLGPAEVPPKRAQTYRMCQWLAARHGIPFRFPDAHPFRSLDALRLLVALAARADAVDAVLGAVFAEGRDLARPGELEALGRALGLDDPAAAIVDPAVKQALQANTAHAIDLGVFGVPTVAVGGELFWGFDTFPMIQDFLADPALFESPEMRRLAQVAYGIPRRTPQGSGG